MIIRFLIILAVFAAWGWFVLDELSGCDHHPMPRDAGWPDSPPEPDGGRGGHFGRPDADVR